MSPVEETLVGACSLAPDYNKQCQSPNALMAASGYLEHRDAIDVDMIRSYLVANPDLIGDWVGYSENKRCNGWYISADSATGSYHVGIRPSAFKSQKEYSDATAASADYIKKELETIAS